MSHLDACERQVREAANTVGPGKGTRKPGTSDANRIPRRTALLTPDWSNNTHAEVKAKMDETELKPWALFWADGQRCLDEIAEALSCEYEKEVTVEQVATFFEAHAELGYIEWLEV